MPRRRLVDGRVNFFLRKALARVEDDWTSEPAVLVFPSSTGSLPPPRTGPRENCAEGTGFQRCSVALQKTSELLRGERAAMLPGTGALERESFTIDLVAAVVGRVVMDPALSPEPVQPARMAW